MDARFSLGQHWLTIFSVDIIADEGLDPRVLPSCGSLTSADLRTKRAGRGGQQSLAPFFPCRKSLAAT